MSPALGEPRISRRLLSPSRRPRSGPLSWRPVERSVATGGFARRSPITRRNRVERSSCALASAWTAAVSADRAGGAPKRAARMPRLRRDRRGGRVPRAVRCGRTRHDRPQRRCQTAGSRVAASPPSPCRRMARRYATATASNFMCISSARSNGTFSGRWDSTIRRSCSKIVFSKS